MCRNRKTRAQVERKLEFVGRELERISDAVDDAELRDDLAWNIRDAIVNIEIQVGALQELLCGPQVAK